MRCTTLRVTAGGIPLRDLHLERLGIFSRPDRTATGAASGECTTGARDAFDRFSDSAAPGVYGVVLAGNTLRVVRREGSGLGDGMPLRLLPTPCAPMVGRFPKPPSPGPYDQVRSKGIATLLTTLDGREFLESCRAAVLGWDGERFVHPPDDRPRVWSTAEQAVRLHLPVRAAPILAGDGLPLLLVNAVAGPCRVAQPGRPPVPEEAIARIRALFASLTVR